MDSEFKVGDLVRVRDWDDMKSQYGLDDLDGYIDCIAGFTEDMRHLCGFEFTILNVEEYADGRFRYDFGYPEFKRWDATRNWYITQDMLERVNDAEDDAENDVGDEYLSILMR